MSKIMDRVIARMWDIIDDCLKDPAVDIPNIILSIPEIAIVDREATPPNRYFTAYEGTDAQGYILAIDDMLKAGWVKEIKDGR